MTTAQIAAKVGISPPEAYNLLARLLAAKRVQRSKAGGRKAPPGQKAIRWRVRPS